MALPESARILLGLEATGGGVARHVLDLAGGLATRGHDVTVLWSGLRAEAGFVRALRALPGVAGLQLDMRRNPGPGDVSALFALRGMLRGAGPFDIVHGHSSKAGALLRLAAAGSGAARVYTPHALVTLDPELSPAKRMVYRGAERVLAWFGEALICVSEEERAHAVSLGLDAAKLHVVHNGHAPPPPPERDAVRAELGLRDDSVCVGFVGRVGHQKAVDRLLRGFAVALAKCPRLRLVVVGDGEDLPALRMLAADLGVAARCTFTGQGDGTRLMAGFDLFAMTSRYEAFPYVYLEALARGLPIVTTPVGGSGAVVVPGENGQLVPWDGPEGFAAVLAALGSDDTQRTAMGRASARRAAQFSIDRMVEETLAVYAQAARR